MYIFRLLSAFQNYNRHAALLQIPRHKKRLPAAGSLSVKSLFLLNIFQTVKCYCNKDDDTGEDKLKVCVNTKDRK